MKRKNSHVEIAGSLETVRKILSDPAQFITNWPYVVRINIKEGLTAEIMLPRFIFKFRDIYRFEFHEHGSGFIYDGTGVKSYLIASINLKEWQKSVSADVELSYKGRGEFLLGKTLEMLAEGIAKSLKDLAESIEPVQKVQRIRQMDMVYTNVDFSDPMSVAGFLSKSKMTHSGLHIINEGALLEVITEIRAKLAEDVLYVSGITQDGTKSFKLLLRGSQILAVEYRDSKGVETVKVDSDFQVRRALELISNVSGPYMINVWVPVGGV